MPAIPGRSLWDPSASYVAVMRLAGSPVVELAAFADADVEAFSAYLRSR